MGCSQGMTGFLDPTVLDEYKDDNGSSFREAANAVGFTAATAKACSQRDNVLQML